MARDNRRFKGLCNQPFQMLEELEPGAALGSESDLARRLDASRTTVRAALAHLADNGVLTWEGREKRLLRAPRSSDYFDEGETKGLQAKVEEMFLAWVLQGDIPPGTILNESDLSRRFDLPLGAVREFLIRFEPFGLITKQPNRHWILNGFTRDFAEEMFEVRQIFEVRALDRLLADGTLRVEFAGLTLAHEAVVAGNEAAALAFPRLDATFHALICSGARNRFITDFSRTIAIIVHYHYLWNKQDEVRRNRAAAAEHLAIIRAIVAGDAVAARTALSQHLATAHRTLIASVQWGNEAKSV
jgi:DNA-binding GntR family transcriptional regulator